VCENIVAVPAPNNRRLALFRRDRHTNSKSLRFNCASELPRRAAMKSKYLPIQAGLGRLLG
jgi:hypothetical protein